MEQVCSLMPKARPARIMIVDDHPIVRDGFGSLISACTDLSVVSEADDITGALREIDQNPPDVAVIDIALKGGNGIDLIREIHEKFPSVRMLAVSLFDEELYGERAIKAGAMGYLNKTSARRAIVDAIRSILDGKTFISDKLAKLLSTRSVTRQGVSQSATGLESLSPRELEVLKLIGEGLMTSQIAHKLFLSDITVATHRRNIKSKLGVKSAPELSRIATLWVLQNQQCGGAKTTSSKHGIN